MLRLALLTAAAVLIHGYHLGVEDGEIYIPAAKKLLDPSLYPYGAEFFQSHERLSLFAPVLAWTARLTHLSMDWTVALWYVATIFATLLACWLLAAVSFTAPRARWGSLLMVTAVLTMPASNTGLLLMDPYLTSRSFSTPVTVAALVYLLQRRYALSAALTVLTAALHPQMAAYLVLLAGILWVQERKTSPVRERAVQMAAAVALPLNFQFQPAPQPYREALYARGFFFVSTWTWYHWLGLLAPLGFLAWFARRNLRATTPEFRRLSFAVLPFGFLSIAAALVLSTTHRFDMFARLQPLRSFHLITLIFVLYGSGVLAEYLGTRWRWVLPTLCVCLAGGMTVVNLRAYPHSAHIELPGKQASSNAWVDTLLWVRRSTPKDAVFAVDSRYFKADGVDVHGFRALADRSTLADYFKDGGVAAMFPNLAVEWKTMSDATYGLDGFTTAQFISLAHRFPVSWAVIHGAPPAGMACPYQQRGYAVCRIPEQARTIPANAAGGARSAGP